MACLLALAATWILAVAAARADSTVTVSTTSDSPSAGQCSLRQAVAYADGTSEPGCAPGTSSGTTTIRLLSGSYTLSTSGLPITASTVISGAGAPSTTISGGGTIQVMSVSSGIHVAISGVTISGGLSGVPTTGCSGSGGGRTCPAETGNNGGGIINAGSLTMTNSVVTNNRASDGTVPVAPFSICPIGGCLPRAGQSAGDGGNGGGIYSTGQLTLDHSTISGNIAGSGGSGTNGFSGAGSNVSAGQTGGNGGHGGSGGGIYSAGGTTSTTTITDSTITGNTAGNGGNGGSGSASLVSSANGGDAGFPEGGGGGGGITSLSALIMGGSNLSSNTTGAGGAGASGGAATGGSTPGSSTPGAQGGFGGGLLSDANSGTTSTMIDDTITANTASAGGAGGSGTGPGGESGGVELSGGPLRLSFSTVAGNSAAGTAGGLSSSSGEVTEADSIVAANTGSPAANCTGTITDAANNVVFGDNSCPGTSGDPKLSALNANGGPTATMALQTGSAAVDRVPVNQCTVVTDQRGLSRPQGGACDAGAYEFAPPRILSSTATAGPPPTAVVGAGINPDLSAKDTTVTVSYGTSAAYGHRTAAQDIGRGGSTVVFSANLAALLPATTYHYRIVAGNGDGTSTTADATFKTKPGQAASIRSVAEKGSRLTLRVACTGGAPGARCSGPVTLTSHVTTRGKAVLGVAASARKHKARPKKVKRVKTVGRGRYSVASGKTQMIKFSLNSAGRKLLSRFHMLPVIVTLRGTSHVSKKVTFRSHVSRRKPSHRKSR